MQNLMHLFGMIMLGLIGMAFVLGLTTLVLCQVRLIVRITRQLSPPERQTCAYFHNTTAQRSFEDHWQN
jgi:Na+-transporting methylmalonyl-CoA/oxaloacetate decarboxylase gamma subunit